MAEERSVPARKYRCERTGDGPRGGMAPDVHAAVQPVQQPALQPPPDRAAPEAESEQLLARHDLELTIGDRGDPPVNMHN
ncbi:MAG: hypothetical protein M3401_16150 [Actinomycetota bacterium]|nr:hypothetical protein [Actinomycetota bacterium]